MPGGNQSGLDKFLFGQAASIVPRDVQVIAVAAALLCLAGPLFYKEFKLLAFDPAYGAGPGLSGDRTGSPAQPGASSWRW